MSPARAATLLALFLFPFTLVAALLARQPLADLARADGLYAEQRAEDGATYHWTGSSATFPIRRTTAPLRLTLSLGPAAWHGRATPTITLAGDQGDLASFPAPDRVRHYELLLPADAGALRITAPVELPPDGEPRYLGVTIYAVQAAAAGLPLWVIPPALGAGLLALLLWWSVRRGHGPVVGLFALALLLRTADLDRSPPGWRVDEVVSLIDAWNLAQTGRDHLGNPLPLGAFEALGDWISPLLTYLELPAVAIFGPQRLVGRLVVAVFGALAAPLCYLLARRLDLPVAGALCAGAVAALSPWQIFMGRIALPPALVPTAWALGMLCGVILIQRGDRRAALGLALAAGLGLYAYPTLKLALPLLAALAAGLALARHGWRRARSWLPAAPLAALLWAPFIFVTLFNPASATRLNQAALRADSWAGWLAAWWAGYHIYLSPAFYLLGDGSSIRSVPGYPIELTAGMPLALLGLAALLWRCAGRGAPEQRKGALHAPSAPAPVRADRDPPRFILAAILIAPLAASLTLPSPHLYRAAPIAPLYALLVGMGLATITQALELLVKRWSNPHKRSTAHSDPTPNPEPQTPNPESRISNLESPISNRQSPIANRQSPIANRQSPIANRQSRISKLQWLPTLALGALLAIQLGGWWQAYTEEYPALQGALNQDGLGEAMRLAVAAPGFDEVWVSYNTIDQPYLFVLAAQALPPAAAQRQIVVERRPGRFNAVPSLGRYRFINTAALPYALPALAAVPHRFGDSGFVLQAWQDQGRRILVVRRME